MSSATARNANKCRCVTLASLVLIFTFVNIFHSLRTNYFDVGMNDVKRGRSIIDSNPSMMMTTKTTATNNNSNESTSHPQHLSTISDAAQSSSLRVSTAATLPASTSRHETEDIHRNENEKNKIITTIKSTTGRSSAEPFQPLMLLGIFTMESKVERRNLIRSTYPTYYFPQVCSLGSYLEAFSNHNDNHTEEDGSIILDDCRVLYTFVIGGVTENSTVTERTIDTPEYPLSLPVSSSSSSSIIIEDANGHKDITLLNIKENMNDGKSITWFAYASTLIRKKLNDSIPYIVKTDDDTLVKIPELLNYMDTEIQPYANKATNLYLGYGSSKCPKLSKKRLRQELSKKVSPLLRLCGGFSANNFFAQGGFYLMSTNIAKYVSSLTKEYRNQIDYGEKNEDMQMAKYVYSFGSNTTFHSDTTNADNYYENYQKPIVYFTNDITKHQLWEHPLKESSHYLQAWETLVK